MRLSKIFSVGWARPSSNPSGFTFIYAGKRQLAKSGEFTYFDQIGEEGRNHSLGKPFSDSECSETFADLAFLFGHLPEPPARILECGCGTGWLSYFLARRGYKCVGQDVSDEAIKLAEKNLPFVQEDDVKFICSDFESLNYENEFDAVIFYSSLHHAEDELAAIESAYRSLRKGGILLAIEPGVGHEEQSREVIELFDVGDRDMPPALIIRRGKQAGFTEFITYPHPSHLMKIFYGRPPRGALNKTLWKIPGFKYLALLGLLIYFKRNNGAVLMRK